MKFLTTPLSGLTPPERSRFFYVMFGFMCVASSALVARTVGDSLFLSFYPRNLLSYMYLGTATVVSTTAYAYGALAGRIPIGRLIVLTCGGLILSLVGLRIALISPWEEFRIVAYLLSDLVVNIPMMLFWSFAALVFNPREAKRLFGFVGAGGTFACILAGLVIPTFTVQFGTSNLLILVAFLICGFLICVSRLSSLESGRIQMTTSEGGTGRKPSQMGYYIGLLKTRQVRNLALLMVTATFGLTLIDYQFKAGASIHYPGDKLAGFFGEFYASASSLALLIQLFLVRTILQRGGVLPALLILPAGLLITSLGSAYTANFSWIVSTKFIVQIFLFTIDTAALQMLYLGVQKQSRNQTRTFVDGIGKPVSIASAGVALVGLSQILQLHHLAIGCATCALLWVFFAHSNYRAYVSALVDSIGAQRFDLSEETSTFQDKTFETHIRQMLASASDSEVSYILGILPEIDQVNWTSEFRALLNRKHPEIKIAGIQYLQRQGDESDLAAILDHCQAADPEVRTASIHAISTLGKQDVLGEIEKGLKDDHLMVRAASVAGLINSGDLDNLINGGVVLKELLNSDNAQNRVAAAKALAHIKNSGLIRSLIGLLKDPDNAVVIEALEACKNHPDHRLVPVVLSLLAESSVAQAAADTLVTFGPSALDQLIPHLKLSHSKGNLPGAAYIPKILAEIGDTKALPVLLQACESSNPNIQKESVQAYAQLLKCVASIKPHLSKMKKVVESLLKAAETYRNTLQEVLPLEHTEILCDALNHAYNNQLYSAFILLDATIPHVNMQAIYLNLTGGDGETRANALEILDNVLKGEVKSSLLKLLESSEPINSGTRGAATSRVIDLLQEEDVEWVTIGALFTVAINKLEVPPQIIHQYFLHSQTTLRETALFASIELGELPNCPNKYAELEKDPDPGVRQLAKSLFNR